MITRFRGDEGELIPKGRIAAWRAIAALRRGTHLTLLADQKMNDGIPVPFFGRPAMTAPALAVLALRFDCDVLPARVERLDGALPAYRISAAAGNPKRRLSCRHRGADDRGQRDLGGVDPRQTGAMALGAPALAGLADYRPLRLGRGPPRPPLAEASAGAFAYRQGVLWILSNPFLPCRPAACPEHPWAQVCRQSWPRW